MKNRHDHPRFATTRWTLVQAANGPTSDESLAALASLCETYWYPLYAFVRRRGHDPESARDLTQAFFTRLLEKGYVQTADRSRGRFRSFLLTACGNFLNKEYEREQTLKRGGGKRPLSLDFETAEGRYLSEPGHAMTPERLFERRWALTLLDRVMALLADEYAQAGKRPLFERLKDTLAGETGGATHGEVAADLGMTEGAVKAAAHRLRQRFRARLRDEIGQVVAEPEEIDDEIRLLFGALRDD